MSAIAEPEGAVDAARGEADHVEQVQGAQQAEVGLPVSLPLEAHQLLHRRLFQDLASLPRKENGAWGTQHITQCWVPR